MENKEINDTWMDLVISILATGGYSLERTYQYVDGLRENGLTDPMHLASYTKEIIARKLVASGYDRGLKLTGMYADRLFSMRVLIKKLEKNTKILSSGKISDVKKLLIGLKGVGPYVIETFLILRGDYDKRTEK